MYNAKPMIASALSIDAELIALLPKVRMFDGTAVFKKEPVYPYLTYEELMNMEGHNADDDEIASEVTFRINVFGTSSLSAIAGHVNRIMKAIGFHRNYSQDQDEVLETGVVVKHKIMSFTALISFAIDSELQLTWEGENLRWNEETLTWEMYGTF